MDHSDTIPQLSLLPKDVLLQIFSLLEINELLSVSLVAKWCNSLAKVSIIVEYIHILIYFSMKTFGSLCVLDATTDALKKQRKTNQKNYSGKTTTKL
jgi:hypothetical protein